MISTSPRAGLVFAVLALLAGILFVHEAEARVIVRESTKYYSVSGRTGAQIYEDIRRKGPKIRGDKRHFVATASFDFDVRNVQGHASGNQCVISDVDVIVSVTYRIPRWTGESKGSQAVRRAWKNFVEFVWKHEKQHAQIAKDFANDMQRALKSIRGDLRKSCSDMASKVEAPAKRAVERHNRRQQAFDNSPWGVGGKVFYYDRALANAK